MRETQRSVKVQSVELHGAVRRAGAGGCQGQGQGAWGVGRGAWGKGQRARVPWF